MNTTPPHTHFGASLMSARFGASLLLVVSLLFGLSSQVAAQTADIPVITATSIDGSGVSRAHIQFGNISGAAVSLNEIFAGTARANTGITIASLTFTQPFGSPEFMALLDCDGKIYITTEGTGYNDTPFSIAVIINDPGTSSFTSGDTLNLIITVNTSQLPKVTTPTFCEPTGSPTDFVTTWRTSMDSESITIPTFSGATYNYDVDWGDDESDTGVAGDIIHTYARQGDYEVRISGTFPRIYINNAGDNEKIIDINQWGNQAWTSMEGAFFGASNLVGTASDRPDLSGVTTMSNMFNGAAAFDQDISTWNVSNVTTMSNMFNGAAVFDQDIGDWDVGSVTNMTSMLEGVTLSTANYDALLTGWATIDGDESALQSNVTFHGGNSTYCNAAAKGILEADPGNNWTITDNGEATGCSADASLSGLTLSTGALNETFVAATLVYTTSVGTSTGTTITAPTTNTFATIAIAGIDPDGTALSVTGNTVSGLTPGANTITITVTAQTGVTRDYTITATQVVAPGDFFVTTWRVEAGDLDITIPTTGTGYNYTVDWGDTTPDTDHSDTDATHTYTAAADYEVRIIGDFPRIFFNNAGDKDKIIEINQWGTQVWTSMERSFYGATNMTVTATDVPDLSGVTDMRFMFALATSFNQDISGWDVSNITSMGNMFDRATSFNQDISGWVTSRLTNTSNMFKDATAFNQNIGGWNVSSLTIMHTMFNGATAFNQDIGSWNVGAVTDMQQMFRDATVFNQDIGGWNVGAVTDMNNMFRDATVFNQDIGGWNVGAVTNMQQMFQDATAFNQDIGGWNVGAVTLMINTFLGATAFDQDIGGWNVGAVTNMQQMFSGVADFDQDIGGWNVGAVTNMQQMFQDATAFDQDISSWDVSSVTDMGNMFNGVTLSTANYDALLRGWSTLTLQSDVTFHGGNSTYCNAVAKGILEADPGNNWTITDNGEAGGCSADASLSGLTLSTGALNETFVAATLAYTTSVGTSVTGTTITAPTTNTFATITIASTGIGGTALSVTGNTVSGLTPGVNTITITVTAQTGVTRDYTITVTRVVAPGEFFVTTWRVEAGEIITIPTTGNGYNYTVDWGDATPATDHTDADATHTYTAAADYEVRIIGDFPRIYFNNAGDKDKIIEINQWGTQQWTSMERSFYGATNMTVTATDVPDLSGVTDMRFMFRDVPGFNTDIGTWNVSTVTQMRHMFNGATSFNQNLGGWDVSNVTQIQGMFMDATAFDQDIGMWNVSNVTHMESMFNGATAFNQDLGSWDVSSVIDMTSMLEGVTLSTANYDALLRGWSTLTLQSNVTFHGGNSTYCNAVAWAMLDETPNNWTITDNGQATGCSADASLSGLTLSTGALNETFDAATLVYTTSVGTNQTTITAPTTNTFATIAIAGTDTDGTALSVTGNIVSRLTLGANTITITVTAQTGVTRDYTITVTRVVAPGDFFVTTWHVEAGDLNITIPTTGNGYNYTVDWGDGTPMSTETGDATHTYTAAADYEVRIIGDFPRIFFNNAGDKDKIIEINQWGTQVWTSMERSFYGATNMTVTATDVPDLSGVTDMRFMFTLATSFNQDISGWDVSNITSMGNMFDRATSFNQDISGWVTSRLTNTSNMFKDASAFNQNIGGWNVSSLTIMHTMFNGATAFNQDIGMWNVGAVTDMSNMFRDATSFNQDIGTWDVGNVTLMINTFLGAADFNQDIGGWNVGAVTNMNQMFSGATAFDQDIGGWNVGAVTDMNTMFRDATVFNQDIGGWNVGAVTNMNQMFSGATAFDQDIGGWNVGAVTDMNTMFRDATVFNQNIGGWNVGAVTNMQQMFSGVAAFDQDISTWDVSNVTTMASMLDNSGLSDTNYDNLLTGWAALTLQPDVTLGAAGINYCTGAAGRTTLAGTPNNWIITDAGLLCGTDITAFSFTGQTGVAVINEVAHTVAVGVAASLTALVPTIAVSSGATIAPASGAAQDFSTDVVYTVTAQDGSTTQAWTVTVTEENAAPDDIALSNNSIDENNAMNTVIGGLSATDANTSDAHTYSLAAGTGDTDNASFRISGSNLVAAVVFDYEAKSAYSVRIATDDSNGGTFEKEFALTVNDVTNISQTITFGTLAAMTFGGSSFDPGATASSGLDVSYTSSDVSVASVAGSTVTIEGAGTTIITASQAGDGDYTVAPDVTQSLVVNKANQTIDFDALAAMTFGGASFNLAATASSGLLLSYSSSAPSIASIAGNTVTIEGAGTTIITASQAGDGDYIVAPDVTQSLVVNQADQTITLTPVTDKETTDAPFEVAASSTSRLPVTFTVGGPATISGATLTLTGTEGTVTITADQAGNSNYNTAPSVEESFDVVDMRTVTGLEEEAPANKILLHPIPANNTIYIDMGDQKLLEMTVTDLNGKQLTVHAKDTRLDISSLKQGYYILRITTDQGVFSQKIIKQ